MMRRGYPSSNHPPEPDEMASPHVDNWKERLTPQWEIRARIAQDNAVSAAWAKFKN